jgi:hypothetical protein
MLTAENYVQLQNYINIELPNLTASQKGKTAEVLWDVRKHAIWLCQEYFQPLPADYDVSPETWLEKTTYTRSEKDKFMEIYNKRKTLKKADYDCKSFIKAETYPEPKYPRPIKSRSDRFKVVMGPIFQGVNEQLFSCLEFFIKKIPVKDRPQTLKDCLAGFDIFDCTDYSSYEAHFIAAVMYCIECVFYRYVTQLLPDYHWFNSIIEESMLKKNKCIFKYFTAYSSSRASGEMCTSSGNGFSNLCVFTYIIRTKRAKRFAAKFEGDDSVNSTKPSQSAPTTQDFTDLGWSCKLETVTKFERASFCGIVSDEQDLINVCDVREYIVNFGWSSSRYTNANEKTKRALLRAKGYSAIYQYPGCPIIEALGHYALRMTDNDVIHAKMHKMISKGQISESRYKLQHLLNAVKNKYPAKINPPDNTRNLVSELYGVDPFEQKRVEKYLNDLTQIQHLEIELNFPYIWRDTWNKYVGTTKEVVNRTFADENCNIIRSFVRNINLAW